MKYKTIQEALESKEGKELYHIVNEQFQFGLSLTDKTVKLAMHQVPCYLGSEDHIGRIVWKILNSQSQS